MDPTFLGRPMRQLPPTDLWVYDGKLFSVTRLGEQMWTVKTVHGNEHFHSQEAAERHVVEMLRFDLPFDLDASQATLSAAIFGAVASATEQKR